MFECSHAIILQTFIAHLAAIELFYFYLLRPLVFLLRQFFLQHYFPAITPLGISIFVRLFYHFCTNAQTCGEHIFGYWHLIVNYWQNSNCSRLLFFSIPNTCRQQANEWEAINAAACIINQSMLSAIKDTHSIFTYQQLQKEEEYVTFRKIIIPVRWRQLLRLRER